MTANAEIEACEAERDDIFRNLEASTNTSERRSLWWAWHIKQAQLRHLYDDRMGTTGLLP